MAEFMQRTLQEFNDELASKAPVPGGGGASALAGATGMALGAMVGSLTVGKKKYVAVEEEVRALMDRAAAVRARLEALIGEDAAAFAPLAAAYGLPKETEEQRAHKAAVMEQALLGAAQAPLAIMRAAGEALELLAGFAQKGSALAVSDAGVGAALCRAALEGAEFNVRINTAAMKDRAAAQALSEEAGALLAAYRPLSDEICEKVRAAIGQ